MDQEDKISRLKEELKSAADPQRQVDILNELSAELSFSDSAQAIRYAERARQLCAEGEQEERLYVAGLAKAYLNLARAYNQRGNYVESMSCLVKARPLYEELGDEGGLMWVHNELGRLYFFISDYPQAMDHYLQTLELSRKIGHANREAASLNNIGQLYNSIGSYEQALENLLQGLEIATRSGDRWVEGFLLGSLAESNYHLRDYEKSLDFGRRSLHLARGHKLPSLINGALQVLSWTHFEMGDYEAARGCLEEILNTAKANGDKRGMAEAWKSMGEQANRKGEHQKAAEFLVRAREKAQELGERAMEANCLRGLAEAYKGQGLYLEAYESLEGHYRINQELYNEKSDLRLRMLSVAHRLENLKREAEIYRLRNMMLQRELEDHKKSRADLEYLANHDHLTGVFNRRYFFRQGAKLLAGCQAGHQPFCLLMLDIDHFKQVNDRHGHLVGDEVLRAVAEVLRQNLRPMDLICRYGGEEFAILLPEMDEEQAGRLSQRLCQIISQKSLEINEQKVVTSVSFGVAQALSHRENLKNLVSKADRALYKAKSAGRNCVRLFSQIKAEEE